jgi:hypothetical protein
MSPSTAVDHLILAALDDSISAAEAEHLQQLLREQPAVRQRYLHLADQHAVMAVDEQLWSDAVAPPLAVIAPGRGLWRMTQSAAAGLLLGLFGGSVAWAIASPDLVATVTRLVMLVDGSFETPPGPLPSGFPSAPGYWSGDTVEVVSAPSTNPATRPSDGSRMLRFVAARPDANQAGAIASSCDLFQVVDLRNLRARETAGELSLTIAAQVCDARTVAGEPLWFTCRLYLFPASAEPLQAAWPDVLKEAQGVAIASHTSHGGPGFHDWTSLSARCLLPEHADLAVVMVSCGYQPGDRHSSPVLGQQYVDGVTLSLHQQPALPTRTVTTVVP